MAMMPVSLQEANWATAGGTGSDTPIPLDKLENAGMTAEQCLLPGHGVSQSAGRLKLEAVTNEEWTSIQRGQQEGMSASGVARNAANAASAGLVDMGTSLAGYGAAAAGIPGISDKAARNAKENARIKVTDRTVNENTNGTKAGALKAIDESGKTVYYIKGVELTTDADGNKPKTHEEKPKSEIDGRHLDTSIIIMSPEGENLLLIQGDAHAKIYKCGGEKPEELAFIREVRWTPFSSYTYSVNGKEILMLSARTGSTDQHPRDVASTYAPVKKFEKASGKDKCLAADDNADEFVPPEAHAVAAFQYMKEDPSHWTSQVYMAYGPGVDVLGLLAVRSHVAARCNKLGPKQQGR